MLTDRTGRVGVLLATLGAVSYGVTVVVGRDLAEAGFGPATSLGYRFAIGGLLLAAVLRVRRVTLLPSRNAVAIGLGLGLLYAVESTFFFSALERGTAAAVSLVFYVYPAMVTMIEPSTRDSRRARPLAAASVGASLVMTDSV